MTMPIVEYIDHMGTDEDVCDAARVSMNKSADLFTVNQNYKLIEYLAKHNHWSPFAHVTVKMRFRAPIFIARQLAKHQVGFAWNEVSRRYVKDEPQFWWTDQFRNSADNIKQGSSSEINRFADDFASSLKFINNYTKILYENAITNGICPEQARAILPQSMMTEWIWTGSLYGWSRMYALRADSHTQKETQEYAHRVGEICSQYFPISWAALTEYS